MAYDEELADRLRELVYNTDGVTEQKMFGGLAFLIDGNMSVAASGSGGILVRVDPAASAKLIETTPAAAMVMSGRTMKNWLHVAPENIRTKRELAVWVKRGTSYAASLPPKQK